MDRTFVTEDVGDFIADCAMGENLQSTILASYGIHVPNIEARLRELYHVAHDCFMDCMIPPEQQAPPGVSAVPYVGNPDILSDSEDGVCHGRNLAASVHKAFRVEIDAAGARCALMLEDIIGRLIERSSCINSGREQIPHAIRQGILSYSRSLPKSIELDIYMAKRAGDTDAVAALEMKLAEATAKMEAEAKASAVAPELAKSENQPTQLIQPADPSNLCNFPGMMPSNDDRLIDLSTLSSEGIQPGKKKPETRSELEIEAYKLRRAGKNLEAAEIEMRVALMPVDEAKT